MFEIFDTRTGDTLKWCSTLEKTKAFILSGVCDYVYEKNGALDYSFCDVRDPKLSEDGGW